MCLRMLDPELNRSHFLRQPHCVGLEAIRVDPPEWSLLGDTGWLVNVTFNRRMCSRERENV